MFERDIRHDASVMIDVSLNCNVTICIMQYLRGRDMLFSQPAYLSDASQCLAALRHAALPMEDTRGFRGALTGMWRLQDLV